MWCGAFASTWIHETARHTWRFDFDSSNSFGVVFVIRSLKYVEQKEMGVCFVSLFFVAFVSVCLAWHFSGALCCVVLLFSFSRCSLFHLASNLARFGVQFCFTTLSPLLTDVLTFTHFPKLTRRLHTPNKSILHLPHLERHSEMLKMCRLFLCSLSTKAGGDQTKILLHLCVCVATA